MKTLDISTRLLSEAVWKRLLEAAANRLIEKRQHFFELMASLESLRSGADYDTGSITTASAWSLYAVSHYFGPRRMLEVGTFIGKSTLALAIGADDARTGIEIHTCDMSNAVELPKVAKCAIHQYPRTASTAMFTRLASNRGTDSKFDLLHLDGRLQAEDFALLRTLCAPDLVVVLDDFEGVEKGVANLANMQGTQFLTGHLLIYPCPEELLRRFGITDHSTTALLIPQSLLRLTAQ